MEQATALLQTNLLDNSLQDWLIAAVVGVAVLVTVIIAKGLLLRYLALIAAKTKTPIDDVALDVLRRTKSLFLLVLAVYAGSLALTLPVEVSRLLTSVLIIALLVQAAIWGDALVRDLVARMARRKAEEDAASIAAITVLGFIGRVVVWSAIVLLALDNIGFNITALVAGLGIGGIAVALAMQNLLGDLFASISIVLDRPFVVGDFIIVDDYLGTVEDVGIKTTRVRSLSGEQLVFSNNDLLNSRIRNYKRMFQRRIVFSIGVVYQTPYDKLKAIPDMLREIIEAQEQTRFDRAHFKSYGDFALLFEIVYYVKVPEYNIYMDIQQTVNLAIFQRFEQAQIEFAYPTQTLFVEKGTG
ncbi:MAG: mechanosensitive ion channel family protein [Acidiferrobacterales bacterium]